MKRLREAFLILALGLASALLASGAWATTERPTARALKLEAKPWKGDFDGMLARRAVRVAVPYSRTLYFNDRGHERGITAENLRDFERYLNRKYAKQLAKRPITFYLIPTTRDELMSDLDQGLADIAAGNLTITPEREAQADFVATDPRNAGSELVVTHALAPPLGSAEELSGRTVHVRKSSSYYNSLLALNRRLESAGRAPVRLVLVSDALEDEDMMDMVSAGIMGAIVVDDWKARAWAPVLPRIRINETAVLRTDVRTGWATRKASPLLQAEIEDFFVKHMRKNNLFSARTQQYASRIKRVKDPSRSADWKRFEQTIELFKQYGARYGFDPLMLAAQGYQESNLNQNARSQVGAIGIMQIMPATGAELRVGDIRLAEPNIHGGAKYMDRLMTNYFGDAQFDDNNRALFAFAAYNAGPGRIASMRKEAARRGLDPNKWFNNVEIVTAEKVGLETTTYVRNIYKYFVAYSLALDLQEEAIKAREGFPGAPDRPSPRSDSAPGG